MSERRDNIDRSRAQLRRSGLSFIALVLALLPICRPISAQTEPPTLRIAAAADLEPVLPILLSDFERETHIHAVASYASSATLTTQIENGAPFDLFLSADMGFPRRLAAKGLGLAGATVQPYARGTLVLWSAADHPHRLAELTNASVHSIALANPQHAPYGRAAIEALRELKLLPALESKLRTAENVAQAAQFVSTGNADVGLISLTLARALDGKGRYEPVPQTAYTPILQGVLVLKHAAFATSAVAFERYLHSEQAQQQLRSRGLEPAS